MKINSFIILVLSALITIMMHACSSDLHHKGDGKMRKIENSPQYHDGKFKNSNPWQEPSFGEYTSVMWDFLFSGDQRTPQNRLPVKEVNLTYFTDPGNNQLYVTWLGHSSLMINIDGYKILTDPVFEKSISLFGPSRFNGDVPLDINQITDVDAVLISHNHYDHLNKFSVQHLNERTKKFMVPLAVGVQLEDWGVAREKIIELDWWDEYQMDEHLMIAATPSQHFSGRGLTDRDETLWASFVIKGPKHKIYFGGDSGYFDGFKQIGNKYGPFDMTFIECGAYNEKWHFIHMFPEETVQANIDLGGKVLHPIHWATFNLSLHAWFDPMERLTGAADLSGVTTATPLVGETTIYEDYIPTQKWWEEAMVQKD